jgi:hypothetical protein
VTDVTSTAETLRGSSRIALELSVRLEFTVFQALDGLVIFPERMHRVHTFTYCARPSTKARTRCRLGSQRRFVTLCAWLILLPVIGPLPQISHRCAIAFHLTSIPQLGVDLITHVAAERKSRMAGNDCSGRH